MEYDRKEPLVDIVITKLNLLLQLNLTVSCLNNVYLLGKSEGTRPILIQFLSYFTKVQVLKECKKLKGTSISITEDLTKEEREVRRVLVKHKKLFGIFETDCPFMVLGMVGAICFIIFV